jgi:hypothetical protein
MKIKEVSKFCVLRLKIFLLGKKCEVNLQGEAGDLLE